MECVTSDADMFIQAVILDISDFIFIIIAFCYRCGSRRRRINFAYKKNRYPFLGLVIVIVTNFFPPELLVVAFPALAYSRAGTQT